VEASRCVLQKAQIYTHALLSSRDIPIMLSHGVSYDQDVGSCEICDEPCDIKCNCDMEFCSRHWPKHRAKYKNHRKATDPRLRRLWGWVKGNVEQLTDNIARAAQFQKDEGAKWFGLVVETSGRDRITTIVETPRFSNLVEDSIFYSRKSPKRQFPSITSFVGECGAGKSTLSTFGNPEAQCII
jgi:hypothetical protein